MQQQMSGSGINCNDQLFWLRHLIEGEKMPVWRWGIAACLCNCSLLCNRMYVESTVLDENAVLFSGTNAFEQAYLSVPHDSGINHPRCTVALLNKLGGVLYCLQPAYEH